MGLVWFSQWGCKVHGSSHSVLRTPRDTDTLQSPSSLCGVTQITTASHCKQIGSEKKEKELNLFSLTNVSVCDDKKNVLRTHLLFLILF